MSLITTIRCPLSSHGAEEEVPVNACVVRYPCPGCGGEVRPGEGDCCVFCSWGPVRVLPRRRVRAGCSPGSEAATFPHRGCATRPV